MADCCTCTPEQLSEVKWGAAVGAALEFGDCPRCFKPKRGTNVAEPTEEQLRLREDHRRMAAELRNFAANHIISEEELQQAVLAERERAAKVAEEIIASADAKLNALADDETWGWAMNEMSDEVNERFRAALGEFRGIAAKIRGAK